jgi:hypothetical protein
MQPETISFASHRWASLKKTRGLDGSYLTKCSYGVGKLCSSAVYFTSHVLAMVARTAWLVDGVEPRSADTLQGLAPITDEQVEAMRFDRAVMALEAAQ